VSSTTDNPESVPPDKAPETPEASATEATNTTDSDAQSAEAPALTEAQVDPAQTSGHGPGPAHDGLITLAIGALGVVFGDIGTSPLYAVREAFSRHMEVNQQNVYGLLCLIFWALVIVICTKYLGFVMKADLHGEGGVLALTVQVANSSASRLKAYPLLVALGLFGTSLLYGDGMITPAISILSAVEGLEAVHSGLGHFVMPITIFILIVLFSAQKHGTEAVGAVFGPIMLVWFSVLGLLGVSQIVKHPGVLASLNPVYAVSFIAYHKQAAFFVLGSVFLVVTGGEAVYADMGHFGRTPIRYAWFFMVFPCLLLNYMGQGALLLTTPGSQHDPFYMMVPGQFRLFVVLLATCATVIASQALISSAFSLTMQAVQMGFVPRQKVQQTSATAKGQIYVPLVNWMLMLACIGLVVGFKTSSNLAAAYGIAVTTTMIIDSLLFTVLTVYGWNWAGWKALSMCFLFLTLECLFFAGNVIKVPEGGWLPLTVGAAIYICMSTWRRGREILGIEIRKRSIAFSDLISMIENQGAHRAPGTAIFMYGDPTRTPPALLSNFKHNRVIHEKVLFVGVRIVDQPFLFSSQRTEVSSLGHGFHLVQLQFGFMDKLNVPDELSRVVLDGLPVTQDATYFLGKETLIPRHEKYAAMPIWRENLFALMSRNAQDATAFFNLPPDRVVELGTQVEI
jgi:KUP system potassium uptake protein